MLNSKEIVLVETYGQHLILYKRVVLKTDIGGKWYSF